MNISETDTEVQGFVLEFLIVGYNIDKRVYKAAAFSRFLNTDESEIYLSYFTLSWLIMSGMLDNSQVFNKKIHSLGRKGFMFKIVLTLAQSGLLKLFEKWISSDSKFDIKKLRKADSAVQDSVIHLLFHFFNLHVKITDVIAGRCTRNEIIQLLIYVWSGQIILLQAAKAIY